MAYLQPLGPGPYGYEPVLLPTENIEKSLYMYTELLNPSNAKATFVQSTGTQQFLKTI